VATPIRGTQSFVGVMSAVWRRPSLSALEITWRWLAGVLISLIVAPVVLGSLGMDIHLTKASGASTGPAIATLRSLSVFQPVVAIDTLNATVSSLLVPSLPFIRKMLPLAILAWLLIATVGRTLVLLRLDPTLKPRRLTFFLLSALRFVLLAAAWALWASGVGWASRLTITGPATHGAEPSLVMFCALLICGTLALYVLWAAASWPLQLAPLLAMRNNLGALASLRAAFRAGPVRGKLLEINLVMNIVKIALIVLAMVLSASPLAFQTVATQQFFAIWWTIAVLLYLAASDYFHLVRAAAYLSLWNAYNG
jgi:hypothetical protein